MPLHHPRQRGIVQGISGTYSAGWPIRVDRCGLVPKGYKIVEKTKENAMSMKLFSVDYFRQKRTNPRVREALDFFRRVVKFRRERSLSARLPRRP